MKNLTKTLWILPIIAGAIVAKSILKKRQDMLNGEKGGKAMRIKREEAEIENALNEQHIDDV